MKATAYLDVKLDSLLQNINFDEFNAAIRAVPGAENLSIFELQEIQDSIFIAADTWLARDLQTFANIETEKSHANGKVFIDLVATNRGTIAPFNRYPDGAKILIDWKSSARPVDNDTFKRRYQGSFQWQKYAFHEPDACLFIYRGISRSIDYRKKGDSTEPAPRTRELILKVHPGIAKSVETQWQGVLQMRDTLANLQIAPWPLNRDNCFAFGRECPFFNECYADITPKTIPNLTSDLSYSKMALFLRCPERYRLSLLAEQSDVTEEDEDDKSTLPGLIIHAGLANLWEQSFRNR